MAIPRITITEGAKAIVDRLRTQHGPLMFHQSGGCCDGSSPMCYPVGELLLSEQDVLLGQVHGCDFYMPAFQFEYWQHTQLELDVTPGRGASFSAEIPLGVRFVTKSRVFTVEEVDQLEPVRYGV